MKTETKEVYKCDFCRRLYQVKSAATRHEERCKNNPANNRPCLNCQNLTKKSVELCADNWDGSESIRSVDVFYCKVKEICMHHPISAHKKSVFDLQEYENHPMPIQCEQQNSHWDNIDFITSKLV